MNKLALLLACLSLINSLNTATAGTRTWTGAVSTDFYNPSNWSPNGFPLANDTLNLPGGTVVISPGFTNSGQINWTGGRLAGALYVASNGVLSVSGSSGVYLDGTITNAGTMTIAGALWFDDYNIQLVNQAGALMDVQGDYSLRVSYGSNQQIVNAGTFRKSAGNSSSTVNIPFLNTGTVQAMNGTLDFQGGGSLTGNCTASAGAAVIVSSGAWVLAPSAVFGGGGLVGVTYGAPTFSGTLATAMQWTGGHIGGNWVIANGGQLSLIGATDKYLEGSITNAGTISFASRLWFNDYNLQIVNQAGGLMDAQGDFGLGVNYGNNQQIINAGTFRKSAGTNSCTVNSIAFLNTGTVQAFSGTVDLQSGGSLTGNCTASVGTAVIFSGGAWALGPSAVFGGGGLVGVTYGGPVLSGTLATAMQWTGGHIGGNWAIANDGQLSLSSATDKYLEGSITNAGTITFGSRLWFNAYNIDLVNQPGALMDIQGDWTLAPSYGANQHILNAGTFRKSTGGGALTLQVPFMNSGQLQIQSGSMTLATTLTLSPDGAISGSMASSDATINGTLHGSLNWTSGRLYGALLIATNGSLSASNSSGVYLEGTITNVGTMTLAGPLWFDDNNVKVVNQAGALLDVAGDYSIRVSYGANQQIVNMGTFRKSAGTNSSTVNIPFLNPGTVQALSGTVDFQSGGSLTGNCTASPGAAVIVSGGEWALGPSAVFGGGGLVGVTYGAPTFSGTLATAMQWTGGHMGGKWSIATGGQLSLSGATDKYLEGSITNAGTISFASRLWFNDYNLQIVNQAGGLMDVLGDFGLGVNYGNNQQIINTGTFRKSAGTNSCSVNSIAFLNTGTVQALSGTMDLQSGGSLTGNCTASGGAAVIFSGGAWALGPSAVFGGGGLVGVTYGGPAFSGTLATAMQWTGGHIGGNWTIANGGQLSLSSATDKYLEGSITNAGTMIFGSRLWFNAYNIQIVNQPGGLVEVQGDYALGVSYGANQQILNAGTFRKSAGTNSCSMNSIAFLNTGTIEALAGIISFPVNFTNLAGGFSVRINSATDWGCLTFASPLVLNGPFSVSLQAGYTPAWACQFQVMTFPAVAGQFSVYSGLNPAAGIQFSPQLTTNAFYLNLAPLLSMSQAGSNILVSWPPAYATYHLYSATNLAKPVWQLLTPTGPNQFQKAMNLPQEYFRLSE